jgi:hypothetical protein
VKESGEHTPKEIEEKAKGRWIKSWAGKNHHRKFCSPFPTPNPFSFRKGTQMGQTHTLLGSFPCLDCTWYFLSLHCTGQVQ